MYVHPNPLSMQSFSTCCGLGEVEARLKEAGIEYVERHVDEGGVRVTQVGAQLRCCSCCCCCPWLLLRLVRSSARVHGVKTTWLGPGGARQY